VTDGRTDTARRQRPRYAERRAGKTWRTLALRYHQITDDAEFARRVNPDYRVGASPKYTPITTTITNVTQCTVTFLDKTNFQKLLNNGYTAHTVCFVNTKQSCYHNRDFFGKDKSDLSSAVNVVCRMELKYRCGNVASADRCAIDRGLRRSGAVLDVITHGLSTDRRYRYLHHQCNHRTIAISAEPCNELTMINMEACRFGAPLYSRYSTSL